MQIDPSVVPESFVDPSMYRAAMCFYSPRVRITFPPRTLKYLQVLGRKIPKQGFLLCECADDVIEHIAFSVLSPEQFAAIEKFDNLERQKEQAIKTQDFELAAEFRDRQRKLRKLLKPENPPGSYEISVAEVDAGLLGFGIDVRSEWVEGQTPHMAINSRSQIFERLK